MVESRRPPLRIKNNFKEILLPQPHHHDSSFPHFPSSAIKSILCIINAMKLELWLLHCEGLIGSCDSHLSPESIVLWRLQKSTYLLIYHLSQIRYLKTYKIISSQNQNIKKKKWLLKLTRMTRLTNMYLKKTSPIIIIFICPKINKIYRMS